MCSIKNAAFDPDDWLGPQRGLITVRVAQGPVGRAWLLACGLPEEESPAAPEVTSRTPHVSVHQVPCQDPEHPDAAGAAGVVPSGQQGLVASTFRTGPRTAVGCQSARSERMLE